MTNMENLDWLGFNEDKIKENLSEIKTTFKNNKLISVTNIEEVLALKKLILAISKDAYFKSEKHKQAFMLINYSSGLFNDELGITRRHRVDKKLAKEWLSKKQKLFHPDKNLHENDGIDYKAVSDSINNIYGEMVGSK